jgi:iron complex transport system substrate-binding protein
VIVVAPCGFDLERSLQEAASLASRPHWDELAAVRAGRVFVVDGNAYFNRSGPRLVDSLEMLAHLVQPARVARPQWLAGATPPWRAF